MFNSNRASHQQWLPVRRKPTFLFEPHKESVHSPPPPPSATVRWSVCAHVMKRDDTWRDVGGVMLFT